jgi:hypothetical protein
MNTTEQKIRVHDKTKKEYKKAEGGGASSNKPREATGEYNQKRETLHKCQQSQPSSKLNTRRHVPPRPHFQAVGRSCVVPIHTNCHMCCHRNRTRGHRARDMHPGNKDLGGRDRCPVMSVERHNWHVPIRTNCHRCCHRSHTRASRSSGTNPDKAHTPVVADKGRWPPRMVGYDMSGPEDKGNSHTTAHNDGPHFPGGKSDRAHNRLSDSR